MSRCFQTNRASVSRHSKLSPLPLSALATPHGVADEHGCTQKTLHIGALRIASATVIHVNVETPQHNAISVASPPRISWRSTRHCNTHTHTTFQFKVSGTRVRLLLELALVLPPGLTTPAITLQLWHAAVVFRSGHVPWCARLVKHGPPHTHTSCANKLHLRRLPESCVYSLPVQLAAPFRRSVQPRRTDFSVAELAHRTHCTLQTSVC